MSLQGTASSLLIADLCRVTGCDKAMSQLTLSNYAQQCSEIFRLRLLLQAKQEIVRLSQAFGNQGFNGSRGGIRKLIV